MKKTFSLVLALLLITSLLVACSGYKEPPEVGFLVADQFSEYKLGTVTDIVPADVLKKEIDSPVVVKFDSIEKGLDSLRNKKIHGFVLPDVHKVNVFEQSDDFLTTQITFIDKKLRALSLSASKFVMPADAALTTLQNDGTLRKIAESYTAEYADEMNPYVRPTEFETLPDRKIIIGICSEEAYPYNYHDENGVLSGINVDIAYEVAKGVYAELEIKEFAENELMSALDSGEADMVLSQFFENEDAPISTKYIYSHPYYDASVHILIRNPLLDLYEKNND